MIIAITGRIGSGKSTVSKEFSSRLQAPIVDADKIAKEITSFGGDAVDAISIKFGDSFIKDGAMDREKMRNLVFSNPSAKVMLEATLKPYIKNKITQELNEANSKSKYVILDIPLLVGSEWLKKVDFVITVDVPESIQQERIHKRNGHSYDTINKMMNAQPSRNQYKEIANYVFDNSTYESFDSHILKCINKIQEMKK